MILFPFLWSTDSLSSTHSNSSSCVQELSDGGAICTVYGGSKIENGQVATHMLPQSPGFLGLHFLMEVRSMLDPKLLEGRNISMSFIVVSSDSSPASGVD